MSRRRSLRYWHLAVPLLMLIVWIWGERYGMRGLRDHLPPSQPTQVPAASRGARLAGRVRYVFDGDTLSLVANDRIWRVRLEGIDAPEHDQPFGQHARDALVQLCDGKSVEVWIKGRDSYDRLLGDVYRDKIWINGQLVRSGFAWQWSRGRQAERLDKLQREARRARRGLWAEPDPVAPWEFRRRQREAASVGAGR
jgi:micrococcal nuclease